MKQLIRRFSRVADSSSYFILRSDAANRSVFNQHRLSTRRSGGSRLSSVPQGHVPVYVGENMERFVVNAEVLNHPIFVELLKQSAQEYGYEQPGALRIPCTVSLFEKALEILKHGSTGGDEEIFSLIG